MLTIEDIRNPSTNSGFSFVIPGGGRGDGRRGGLPWKASKQVGIGPGCRWNGPRRATAAEAAQDFCDYVNGNSIEAAPVLKSAGHKTRTPRNPDELSYAERMSRYYSERAREEAYDPDAPAYVYCIGEEAGALDRVGESLSQLAGSEWVGAVKIGWAKDPEVRAGTLQHGNPRLLGVLGTITTTVGEVEALERSLHSKYITQNILGEWFSPSPELLAEFGL